MTASAANVLSSPPPSSAGLKRLWKTARRHRPRIFGATVATTLGKVMDVFPEILIGAVIDVVVRGEQSFLATWLGIQDVWPQLVVLAIINAVVWILESTFGYISAVMWRNIAQSIQHDIRTGLYAHVQNLEVSWFEDTTSGGLLSVLNDDINQLERFLDSGASSIIELFWNIVLVGLVFAASSTTLLALAFLPIPLITLGSIYYQKRLGPRYRKVREKVADLSSTLAINLGGITTIKAFHTEEQEARRVETTSNEYRQANQEAIRYSAAFVPLIRMLILAGFTCTLVVGGYLVLQKQLEVALYSVLIFMTQRLLWPMTRLGETLDQYQRFQASIQRIFKLLDAQPQMQPGLLKLPPDSPGEIEFQNVSFAYHPESPILKKINLKIPAGETHAIVGTTGSGKSTLLKLLLRFHDPDSGKITLDGHDLKDLQYNAIRQAIGFVGQDVFLFQGTIQENIAYGSPQATLDEISQAAQAAEAHPFIQHLPQSYATTVGDKGQKLSAGQKQRITLARALLRNPTILVLDEATSNVDNETEAAIQNSLAKITQDRTTLLVAHRLSTVRNAHKIWVLEHGSIAESGTHEELLQQAGIYAALWRIQTGNPNSH
ncbi:MAG TPA: ABC transporter ATP-binding protein [Fimbriimonadaceae bacterium]|nr:ABC transporter ATP-binding protein [Fimbriimonadaceae bacterium]HRJ33564.1 ABC transporter ATP-binding protein [Fimbriimonadaceae bacterium]